LQVPGLVSPAHLRDYNQLEACIQTASSLLRSHNVHPNAIRVQGAHACYSIATLCLARCDSRISADFLWVLLEHGGDPSFMLSGALHCGSADLDRGDDETFGFSAGMRARHTNVLLEFISCGLGTQSLRSTFHTQKFDKIRLLLKSGFTMDAVLEFKPDCTARTGPIAHEMVLNGLDLQAEHCLSNGFHSAACILNTRHGLNLMEHAVAQRRGRIRVVLRCHVARMIPDDMIALVLDYACATILCDHYHSRIIPVVTASVGCLGSDAQLSERHASRPSYRLYGGPLIDHELETEYCKQLFKSYFNQ
jgi:hypothetical protein